MGKLIIYSMMNAEGRFLYIGKTKDLGREIDAIVKSDLLAKKQLVQMTKEVKFIEVEGEVEAEFVRRHLIQTTEPLYNDKKEVAGQHHPYTVTLWDIEWESYWGPAKPKMSLFNKVGYAYAENSTEEKIQFAREEEHPILKVREIQIHEMDLERKETAMLPNAQFRKYCRYIIMDGKRYFYISDLLELLDGSGGKKRQAELLKSGLLNPEDILILEEEGTYKIDPGKLKRTMLGNDRWLELKVLQSVSLRAYKGEPGWTEDTTYLYAGLLDKDPRTAPEYRDLLEKPDELNDLAWIERRMKEERARAEAANKSGDFLFDIREMLLAIEEDITKQDAKLIVKGKTPIPLKKPEELVTIKVRTEDYEAAGGANLAYVLQLWQIENDQKYGVVSAERVGDSPFSTFQIQAGFFHKENFDQLLATNYNKLVQAVSNVEAAEEKWKRLRSRYEDLKMAECEA